MEDIRTLARSGRGAAAAASILHPRMVNPAEYTEDNAIASTHGELATALYEERTRLDRCSNATPWCTTATTTEQPLDK